jgi:hydroxymethylglutaryl-CoA lyase
MDFSVYEVGPRDGLQSADTITPTRHKVEMIERISKAGIRDIEVGAMVNPDKVPNMADSAAVYRQISYLRDNHNLGMLVPNKIGVERAKKVGVNKFNVFFSPSDYFNVNNFGRTLSSIFTNYCTALQGIPKQDVRVYLSTAFGCPMIGDIPNEAMQKAINWADSLGSTIVLCDTVGKANPMLIADTINKIDVQANLALHLHHGPRKNRMFDNLSAGFDCGITQFDSSIGGMGGCPFILGSGGNLATEELVMWGEKENLDCGVTIEDIGSLSKYVESKINV